VGASLAQALGNVGMSVDWARDGTDASLATKAIPYALILLDLGLPGIPGLRVLEELRQRGDKTPLIVITARDDTEDRVTGLDLGADDYVVKPFAANELIARMHAVLRRQSGHAVSTIGNAHIMLNLTNREVTYCGKTELLPAREFALMLALLQRPG